MFVTILSWTPVFCANLFYTLHYLWARCDSDHGILYKAMCFSAYMCSIPFHLDPGTSVVMLYLCEHFLGQPHSLWRGRSNIERQRREREGIPVFCWHHWRNGAASDSNRILQVCRMLACVCAPSVYMCGTHTAAFISTVYVWMWSSGCLFCLLWLMWVWVWVCVCVCVCTPVIT